MTCTIDFRALASLPSFILRWAGAIFAIFRVQRWNPYVTCVLHRRSWFSSAAFWWKYRSQSGGRHNPVAAFAAWLLDVDAAYIYSIVGRVVGGIEFLLALDRSCIEIVELEETIW
jgi:hypothetical protein